MRACGQLQIKLTWPVRIPWRRGPGMRGIGFIDPMQSERLGVSTRHEGLAVWRLVRLIVEPQQDTALPDLGRMPAPSCTVGIANQTFTRPSPELRRVGAVRELARTVPESGPGGRLSPRNRRYESGSRVQAFVPGARRSQSASGTGPILADWVSGWRTAAGLLRTAPS